MPVKQLTTVNEEHSGKRRLFRTRFPAPSFIFCLVENTSQRVDHLGSRLQKAHPATINRV